MESELSKLREAHWRYNKRLMTVIAAVWLIQSLGFGVIWVERLNLITLGGFKLGFWFAQQGAIYGFVVLIFAYSTAMTRFEKHIGVEEEQQ